MFNLKSNLCQLVFNVWWDHTWCFGASFCCFGVSLFRGLVMPRLLPRNYHNKDVINTHSHVHVQCNKQKTKSLLV